MSAKPNHNITAEKALILLNANEPIKDVFVSGKLSLTGLDDFDKAIVIDNCILEYLEGNSTQFTNNVKLTNSEFKLCDFTFTYFLGGMEIENCVFESYLDFQAGGHNKNNQVFSIRNSIFKGFVNFFDCWYESRVVVENNDFKRGTNLLGKHKETGIETRFDVTPLIEKNNGVLNIEDEGDVESKAVFLLWPR